MEGRVQYTSTCVSIIVSNKQKAGLGLEDAYLRRAWIEVVHEGVGLARVLAVGGHVPVVTREAGGAAILDVVVKEEGAEKRDERV